MNSVFNILLWGLILFSLGCTPLTKRSTLQEKKSAPTPTQEVPEELPPARPEMKIGLILGPGALRSIAYSGVLQELEKNKAPVTHIVGLEWGALMAGFYAASGSATKVQWQLQKLQKKDFASQGFLSKTYDPIKINELLNHMLGSQILNMRTENLSIKFACPTMSYLTGKSRWVESGSVGAALKACVPSKPLYLSEAEWFANVFASGEAVEYLARKSVTHIVFINSLKQGSLFSRQDLENQPELGLMWHEVRRQTQRLVRLQKKHPKLFLVNIDMPNASLFELGSVNMLGLAGQRAAKKLIKELDL